MKKVCKVGWGVGRVKHDLTDLPCLLVAQKWKECFLREDFICFDG